MSSHSFGRGDCTALYSKSTVPPLFHLPMSAEEEQLSSGDLVMIMCLCWEAATTAVQCGDSGCSMHSCGHENGRSARLGRLAAKNLAASRVLEGNYASIIPLQL